MTTRLNLYNDALLECGERDLASLSENRESRRLLDRVWDSGAVRFCLSRGQWKFAKRTVMLAPETGFESSFGYANAYTIPDDFVRTIGVWSDEYLTVPLLQYTTEGGKWLTDVSPIYVAYVSDDAAYGGDLSNWPEDFATAVSLYLASKIILKLTQSVEGEKFKMAKCERAFRDAAGSDAMESPTLFPPSGSWVSARAGGIMRDRGPRNRFTS